MSVTIICIASAFSLFWACRTDWGLLRRGIPTLGVVVTGMYVSTYGLGLTLWRFDPSSLFGYRTASTLGSLDRLGYLFAFGITSLVLSYSLVRKLVALNYTQPLWKTAESYRPELQRLCCVLLILGIFALFGMMATGLFLRDSQQQQQALHASALARLLIGTGISSRLAPVALVLVPFAWKSWSPKIRSVIALLLIVWASLTLASGSRGQLLSLPLCIFIGSIIWQNLSLKRALLFLLAGLCAFVPIAEVIRVNRSGDASNPELHRSFETFQIGKQLMGTSHEFYLFLNPDDCSADLENRLDIDPTARRLLGLNPSDFESSSPSRWNVVRLYEACSKQRVSYRSFSDLSTIPLALLPNTIFPSAPSMFDGQRLVESLSSELDLRPGEVSHGTISLFADSWWRWRWPGVITVGAFFGFLFALIQTLLLILMRKLPMPGLLGQLLVVSLLVTWINNTTLTMLWYVLWDLPKAWLELTFLSFLIRFRSSRGNAQCLI